MGKKTLIGIGLAVICFGGVGVYNALTDLGEPADTVHDLTTTGRIIGAKSDEASGQQTVKYSFRTEEGRIYFGQQTIEAAENADPQRGDKVTVFYQSESPRESMVKIGPEEQSANADAMLRLKVCFGTALFGLLIVVTSFFCKEDKVSKTEPGVVRKFSDDPQAALLQWKSEWTHAQVYC